jgi:NAD-dependent deacetylase
LSRDNTTLPAVADAVRAARSIVALTGAGISAESGVPTFRGADGLWRSFRPEDLATPEAFARDPSLVWNWYRWRRSLIAAVRPNPGHVALARLESRLRHVTVLTQNVDGLHRAAGSVALVELHGNIWRARCTADPARVFDGRLAAPDGPADSDELPRCECGALLRPDVVWFGEALDAKVFARATDVVRSCDVLLIVGTSGVVYPVAALPEAARQAGATLVEINLTPTPLTAMADYVLQGPAGVVLPALDALV